MKKKGSYVGAVKNTGSQYVQAPVRTEKKRTGNVKKGTDLRTETK